jgi:ribosomal protein S18 acetylase RimI-like enzyme
MISIRPATIDDALAITRVQIDGWRNTYQGIVPDDYLASLDVEKRTPRWREILASSTRVLVAEQHGTIIGFASGGAIREPIAGYDAELYAIYLDLAARGRGVGKSMVRALAKRLEEEGFTNMVVWVLEANAAVGFYEQLGATLVAAKTVTIGGAELPEIAYAWSSLKSDFGSE